LTILSGDIIVGTRLGKLKPSKFNEKDKRMKPLKPSEVIQEALRGMSAGEIQKVLDATKRRAVQAQQANGVVDRIFVERAVAEYADDLRNGRTLDQEGTVYCEPSRNFGEQYRSPKYQYQ